MDAAGRLVCWLTIHPSVYPSVRPSVRAFVRSLAPAAPAAPSLPLSLSPSLPPWLTPIRNPAPLPPLTSPYTIVRVVGMDLNYASVVCNPRPVDISMHSRAAKVSATVRSCGLFLEI